MKISVFQSLVMGIVLLLQTVGYAQVTAPENNIENSESEYKQELDKWMLKAYEGDPDAQFKVGVLFTNDQFREPDFEQAVYWYKQAAGQDHVMAQYNLGHQYLVGQGVQKSNKMAMHWWLAAAKQGHALAQFNIGRAYYLGIGLPEDHEKSYYWFEQAAQNQEPKSIQILEQLGWSDGLNTDYADHQSQKKPQQGTNETEQASTDHALTPNLPKITDPLESSAKTTSSKSAFKSRITPTDEVITIKTPEEETRKAVITDHKKDNIAPPVTINNKDSKVVTKQPIALYTDPSIRSVLITILDNQNTLNIIKEGESWIKVNSSKGFPVWVHKDFVTVSNGTATLTGNKVNARSVPIITKGTVVGQLNKKDQLKVLDQQTDWLRVEAPTHFTAWVKSSDMERKSYSDTPTPIVHSKVTEQTDQEATTAEQPKQEKLNKTVTKTSHQSSPDDWLFSRDAEYYTLQLGSFNDPEKIKQFVNKKEIRNDKDLYRFISSNSNSNWTFFLYGNYADRTQAEAARKSLGHNSAWIRKFGKIRQNRCVSWKKQLPPPPQLNEYCIN